MPELIKKAVKKATKKVTKKVAAVAVKPVVKKAVKKVAVKKVAAKKQPARGLRTPIAASLVGLAPAKALENLNKAAAAVNKPVVEEAVVALSSAEAPSNPLINWDELKAKYKIAGFKPETLKILPRDDFMQSLVSNNEQERPIEDVIYNNPDRDYSEPARQVRQLAGTFIKLRVDGARLPKFGKWVSSLFPNNQDFQRIVGQRGQAAGKGAIVVSTHPADILRGGEVNGSCLRQNGGYMDVLPAVLEQAPGIAVVYIDNGDGGMKGRLWIHHGKVVSTGEDVVVFASYIYGNGFTEQQVVDHFADMGYRCFRSDAWGGRNPGSEKVEFINCFDKSIHWDTYTWANYKTQSMQEVRPSLKKAA